MSALGRWNNPVPAAFIIFTKFRPFITNTLSAATCNVVMIRASQRFFRSRSEGQSQVNVQRPRP